MTYQKDGNDSISRVTVYDAANTPLCYGVFSYGVNRVVVSGKKWSLRTALEGKGRRSVVLRVALDEPSTVRCELLSLSGKRLCVMLNEPLQKGVHRRLVPLVPEGSRALSRGVYCAALSINGQTVAVERLLVQDREAVIR
ncbi:MAG: hypothetical protein JXA71_10795, partial [Chitinispirillaceae bacterium]|nr:hypothetical protein [Chitinispirillaceae bacterium]